MNYEILIQEGNTYTIKHKKGKSFIDIRSKFPLEAAE